jgi:hypothetical protein
MCEVSGVGVEVIQVTADALPPVGQSVVNGAFATLMIFDQRQSDG